MNRTVACHFRLLLTTVAVLSLSACSGGVSNNAALNLGGTWTISTVSTQGHGSSSGTATISQSGQGLAVTGTTTLAAPIGKIVISQTGTALAGTITNSLVPITFNFIGTLSSGNLTITGSTTCGGNVSQSTSIAGTITSNSIQGTYTLSRGSGCYYPNDAGTFVATKH
jgi:hypothetical protein